MISTTEAMCAPGDIPSDQELLIAGELVEVQAACSDASTSCLVAKGTGILSV